jgi:hypothetical protein
MVTATSEALLIALLIYFYHFIGNDRIVNKSYVAPTFVWSNGCREIRPVSLSKMPSKCLANKYEIVSPSIYGIRYGGLGYKYYRIDSDIVEVRRLQVTEPYIRDVYYNIFSVNKKELR